MRIRFYDFIQHRVTAEGMLKNKRWKIIAVDVPARDGLDLPFPDRPPRGTPPNHTLARPDGEKTWSRVTMSRIAL